MTCANHSFLNHGTLRSIPAPSHVLLDAFVPAYAPSVLRKPSKSRSKPLVIQAGKGEPQSRPHHGYQLSFDTTSLPSFVTSIDHETHQSLPLLVQSMVVEGISPQRELPAHIIAAAHDRLESIARRSWPTSQSSRTRFLEYCRLALSMCQFLYPEADDLDRIVAVATIFAVMFLIDDVFDSPCNRSSLVADYGLDPAMSWEFLRALNELLRQHNPPMEPCSPIQRIMWDVGQEMRRMSTPGFLTFFVDAIQEHHRVVLASRADFAGACECLRTLDSYTAMRVGNSGGLFTMAFVEFAHGEFLPDDVRVHPFTAELTDTCIAQAVMVNDIFSYPKEVLEENPANVIALLMESRQISLTQAAWQVVEAANSYHGVVMTMQRRLKDNWEPVKGSRAPLLKYLSRVRDLYSGSIYWSSLVKRYRVADSAFPELRGCPHPHEILQRI